MSSVRNYLDLTLTLTVPEGPRKEGGRSKGGGGIVKGKNGNRVHVTVRSH